MLDYKPPTTIAISPPQTHIQHMAFRRLGNGLNWSFTAGKWAKEICHHYDRLLFKIYLGKSTREDNRDGGPKFYINSYHLQIWITPSHHH